MAENKKGPNRYCKVYAAGGKWRTNKLRRLKRLLKLQPANKQLAKRYAEFATSTQMHRKGYA